MKLKKKLSTKQFFASQFLILVVGLIFIGVLYYILNIQYQEDKNNPFSAGPLTQKPRTLTLDLNQPGDEILTFQNSVVVSGKTSPLKEVLIFTDKEDLVVTSKNDGSFSTIISLDEGVNRIVAEVFDTNGETKSVERTVFYTKEKI